MTTSNIDNIINRLNILRNEINDFSPYLYALGNKIITTSEEAFDKETDPITGKRWKPTHAKSLISHLGGRRRSTRRNGSFRSATLRRIREKRILVATGDLKNSLNFEISNNTIIISANKEYANVHNFGSPSKNIVQRRFMPFSGVPSHLRLDDKILRNFVEDIESSFNQII